MWFERIKSKELFGEKMREYTSVLPYRYAALKIIMCGRESVGHSCHFAAGVGAMVANFGASEHLLVAIGHAFTFVRAFCADFSADCTDMGMEG